MKLFVTDKEIYHTTPLSRFTGRRYGKPWTCEEFNTLNHLFAGGYTLEQICIRMERPAAGVIAKLSAYLAYDGEAGEYYIKPNWQEYLQQAQQRAAKPTTTKENTMSNPIVETIKNITMINGRNGVDVSDDEIFTTIAKLERDIELLGKIQNKPKKLDAKIAAMQAEIKALVEYVDTRE